MESDLQPPPHTYWSRIRHQHTLAPTVTTLTCQQALSRSRPITRTKISRVHTATSVFTTPTSNVYLLTPAKSKLKHLLVSSFARRAFSVAGTSVWNSLPEYLRDPAVGTVSGNS